MRVPEVTAYEALCTLRAQGVAGAMDELPNLAAFSPRSVSADGEQAIVELLDTNGLYHHLHMPSGFARAVLMGDERAATELRRIIRAPWN